MRLNSNEFLLMVSRYNKYYTRILTKIADEYNMSKIEIDVLLFLHNNPGFDTAKEICELRGLGKSHISKAVDLLCQKKYLETVPDGLDKRITHLVIKSDANDVIHKAKEAQENCFRKLLNGISTEDLYTMKKVITQISMNLSELNDSKAGETLEGRNEEC